MNGTDRRRTLFLCAAVLSLSGLAACAPEMGRRITDTDISCLRAQTGSSVGLSFPLAANMCQRTTAHNYMFGEQNAKPIPLDLKGAPDLQKQADEYGYSYTR
ncbi:hypothetical protein LOC54_01715 [Acetobacter sp. AN02]|uniref:hypothetical protein n=1 Tax=Acetobacter sp. AN02 TaxID=2894186 RepID=UPI0024342563|nr:hypothetical protein [Acetobacter sp. AN02]MDG6093840.1 hypothetical protein [Acetobacter sp. AN02]